MKRINTVADYSALYARWIAVCDSRRNRAKAIAAQAGLGIGCQLHNALVSRERGKPWQGVNYSLARKADRLLSKQFEGRETLDRAYTKALYREHYEGRPDAADSATGRAYARLSRVA